MSAAKKIILLLWLVIVASLTSASALTPGATKTRVGQKSFAALESRQTAERYADFTFASPGHALTDGNNTFTTIAENAYGLKTTNTATHNLPATINLSYDSNGNLTNDGHRTFAYDADNQLTNVTVAGAWKADFVHDALGRKRIERNYTWNGTWSLESETRYLYDGLLVVQERDDNNQPQATYTRGVDLSGSMQGAGGIGGLLARTESNGTAYYHADGVGNVTALIDEQERVVARYLYDPFGNQLGQWGDLAQGNRYRFSSKEVHPQSGLYYYGYRFYEPNLQRWLNEDPMGEAGGINLYRFVHNSPVRFVDLDGLAPQIASLTSGPRGTITAHYGEVGLGPREETTRSFLGLIRIDSEIHYPFDHNWEFDDFNHNLARQAYELSLLVPPPPWEPDAGGIQTDDGILFGLAGFLRGPAVRCLAAKEIAPGLARRLKYGENWGTVSLDKAISRHLGNNYTSWQTATRKIIYESPATGRQIVRDMDGDYFRIFQPKKIGGTKGQYLDMMGRPMPNTDKGQMMSHFIIE